MDSSGNSLIFQLMIIIILTGINAFFAAAEIAFVSINQSKMRAMAEEEGNKKAERVLRLIENADDFLATIQVAITLAGFLSSASAATSFAEYFNHWIPNFPGATTVSIVVVTVILSYITLVFGELYPKQVALQMPDQVAMATSGVVEGIQRIFKPFVQLLSLSTGLLKRITPIDFNADNEQFTREEMVAILNQSQAEGAIDLAEYAMLEGVLSLDSKLAREVMVPRTDTQMIDIEDDYEEILSEILSSPYSRLPIYEESKDNVIGVLHVKSLLKAAQKNGFDNVDFMAIANEPLFVPSTAYIDDLLVEFRREETHMAILRDEYGGVEGIVTLEDLIEEIVGDINDESDITATVVRKIDDANYYINGVITLEKYNHYFDEDLDSEEVDTIAGLMIQVIGYVPDDEERISVRMNDYVLTTSNVENGRIRGIHVTHDPSYAIETEFSLHAFLNESDRRESDFELDDN
ncbi:HlyC/CorC family transporter [Facklamia sp. DSM 111018]|uniref:HlyC/CorC family transporter n=1 Tax=Facklamia lactis TaxID=2749967 RepID=A0ABS0LTH5_9LACT|nr:hemolysin family protein [Facklamia lactis]MBG9980770.1 HlyC/CorC family transporter [Facklamia lactis]MBG9986584.1 HlyC/CorC family transporter [Facklamia lactis]